jgi:hypothetical protein
MSMNGRLERLRASTLTFRIVSGQFPGIATGLSIGESAGTLQGVAAVWVGLVQMTVLP